MDQTDARQATSLGYQEERDETILSRIAPRRPEDRRGAFRPAQALRAALRVRGRTVHPRGDHMSRISGNLYLLKIKRPSDSRNVLIDA